MRRRRAILDYLRGGHFTYDTAVGAPPHGEDPLRYFLFSSRRGYCVHFASAMAVLARAAGLSARVVGGYVTGRRVGDTWVVDGADAHTWPEISFAGLGWVPFEPTPGYNLSLASLSPAVPVVPYPIHPRSPSLPRAPRAERTWPRFPDRRAGPALPNPYPRAQR